MRVDLHCHSSVSDGCLSPELVAAQLLACRVRCAALADHHTFIGQQRFHAALQKRGVQSITGVEIFVESPLGPLHLLAYGCDVRHRALLRVLRVLAQPVWGPMRHWMERSWQRGTTLRWKPHTHRAGHDEPAALAHGGLLAVDAISVIHDAGGHAFLAHPLLTAANWQQLTAQVATLSQHGLDGIEVFYKPYAPEIQQKLLELALRYDLLASAGSDFHGPSFPGGAGPGCEMPDEQWQRFATALKLETP